MNNTKLSKILLILSLTGIFILFLLSDLQQPKTTEIKEINELMLNKRIQVQGKIEKIKNYEDFQILKIADKTKGIEVLVNKKTNLTINDSIKVSGKLAEYNRQFQIKADKIQISYP